MSSNDAAPSPDDNPSSDTTSPSGLSAYSPSFTRPRRRSKSSGAKPSIIDELLPTPASRPGIDRNNAETIRIIRRTAALGILVIFILSIVFLASTEDSAQNGSDGLRRVFGFGSDAVLDGANWTLPDVDGIPTTDGSQTAPIVSAESESDFERYTMLRTLPQKAFDTSDISGRVIFIGDIHGSFQPLLRLMKTLSYDENVDHLIHVGDLVAKGLQSEQVLTWMNQRQIQGVRGNHDQPVVQWRAWMEWAGGNKWESYVDSLAAENEKGAVKSLQKQGKMYPETWKWHGEHWKLARNLAKYNYLYLLELPLVLHIPSLHAIVVHAGLLPHDPRRSSSDISQPLVSASSSNVESNLSRISEEISIIVDVPQNQDPWTLLNMRSIYTSGKRKGKTTKSSRKGTPWSDVWKAEMERCNGPGKWFGEGMEEWTAEHNAEEDNELETEEDEETDELAGQDARRELMSHMERGESLPAINCSPVTVIYGHAAGRGLDIKPFSKGLDTGCVYGRQLTALVLGNTSGLAGQHVMVGEHRGLTMSEECGEEGT